MPRPDVMPDYAYIWNIQIHNTMKRMLGFSSASSSASASFWATTHRNDTHNMLDVNAPGNASEYVARYTRPMSAAFVVVSDARFFFVLRSFACGKHFVTQSTHVFAEATAKTYIL